MLPFLGIGWQISTNSGWGVFGMNLARELMRRGEPEPLMLYAPGAISVDTPEDVDMLDHMYSRFHEIDSMRVTMPEGQKMTLKSAVVMHSLGNRLIFARIAEDIRGGANVGMVFFEDTQIDDLTRRRARQFDRILAGSTWNADVLRAAGLGDVRVALQGVDLALFRPRLRKGTYGGRFVVFSGGKLEYRKGQDIVLAAFKAFRERHPDSVLLTAWQSPWPGIAKSVALGPHETGAPEIDEDGTVGVEAWAEAYGLPAGSVVDLGLQSNVKIAEILAEVDVALFPNRCEGGTNLVAMEAMAAGVPVILSDNTGHKDLIAGNAPYVLEHQSPIGSVDGVGTDGWGESSVDEAAGLLERAYTDRDEMRRRIGLGIAFMRGWTWKSRVATILENLDDLA